MAHLDKQHRFKGPILPILTISIVISILVFSMATKSIEKFKPYRKYVRHVSMTFIGLFLLEQFVLSAYIVPLSYRQDNIFLNYIKSIRFDRNNPPSAGSHVGECEYGDVFVIYRYKMCIYGNGKIDGTNFPQFSLILQPPSGYISLLSRDYSDRIIFDGKKIYDFDGDGNVISDFRK